MFETEDRDRAADANLPHDDDHALRLDFELDDDDADEGTVGDENRLPTQEDELQEALEEEDIEDATADMLAAAPEDEDDEPLEAEVGRGRRVRTQANDPDFQY